MCVFGDIVPHGMPLVESIVVARYIAPTIHWRSKLPCDQAPVQKQLHNFNEA